MQLIHLAPRIQRPALQHWVEQLPADEPVGLVVDLAPNVKGWILQSLQPGSQSSRQELGDFLELDSAQQEVVARWFQAIDWLEQAPANFSERLTQWVTERRAGQLARQLGWATSAGAGQRWVAAGADLLRLAHEHQPRLCTFWLDEPAFFTADPSLIPQARLLRQLDTICAQELARLKGLELDSALLDGLAAASIPVEVGWLNHPDWTPTRILPQLAGPSQVLTVACSGKSQVVSLKSPRMWRRPGFLAEAFGELARMGLSVDLLATSQASVTLTLDPGQQALPEQQQQLSQRLDCQVDVLEDCATIHLVGTKIRQLLPQLGPALELFDEHPIHLVSQASSDVSLSFVVSEEQAERLLIPLHALLFGGGQESETYGPTYQQLRTRGGRPLPVVQSQPWWVECRETLLQQVQPGGTYCYHQPSLLQRAAEVCELRSIQQRFYALKANPHPDILALFVGQGFGLECVSPGELARAREATAQCLYTPNFVEPFEYQTAFQQGCKVTLDNLDALRRWPEIFTGQSLMLRLDSGTGTGHHKHVRTAGDSSKFGISAEHWPELARRLKEQRVEVLGLHCHAGSGITDAEHWVRTARFLDQVAEEHFPGAAVLNLGGGLGIPDRPGKQRLDFERLEQTLQAFLQLNSGRQLWLEPGRYLVAEAGVLLSRITQIKTKGQKRYLGLDVGMHTLIRPALYGAYHPIVNLSKLHEPPAWKVDVVGPICESGDVLGHDRWMPESEVGDVVLIANAGAYGASMASHYNLRAPAREVLLLA